MQNEITVFRQGIIHVVLIGHLSDSSLLCPDICLIQLFCGQTFVFCVLATPIVLAFRYQFKIVNAM